MSLIFERGPFAKDGPEVVRIRYDTEHVCAGRPTFGASFVRNAPGLVEVHRDRDRNLVWPCGCKVLPHMFQFMERDPQ